MATSIFSFDRISVFGFDSVSYFGISWGSTPRHLRKYVHLRLQLT